MSYYFLDCRRKQSFPAFWFLGSFVGLGFTVMGAISVYTYASSAPSVQDKGNLFFGIGAVIVGLLLITGVIVTAVIMSDPDNLSLRVDVKKDSGKNRYKATKLTNYIDVCHNNVLLFDTDNGQMRVYGSKGCFIIDVLIRNSDREDDFASYHLTNPAVSDESPTIIGNLFFERFPVRKNRIVNKKIVFDTISKLYELQDLPALVSSFPFTDTTEETKRLIEKDAYILPSVPFVFYKKQEDIDRNVREKNEREQRALQELRGS